MSQKIVINTKIGGYLIPISIVDKWIIAQDEQCYKYYTNLDETCRVLQIGQDYPDLDDFYIFYAKDELTDFVPDEARFYPEYDIPRTDGTLIELIMEEIKTNPKSIFKIIEIPDGVEYFIDCNEMGQESIHENHRVWY